MCLFLLYSKRDSVIHVYTLIISHPVLSQWLGYGSLGCTVGPHCLSILNIIIYIYQPQTPPLSTPSPLFVFSEKKNGENTTYVTGLFFPWTRRWAEALQVFLDLILCRCVVFSSQRLLLPSSHTVLPARPKLLLSSKAAASLCPPISRGPASCLTSSS